MGFPMGVMDAWELVIQTPAPFVVAYAPAAMLPWHSPLWVGAALSGTSHESERWVCGGATRAEDVAEGSKAPPTSPDLLAVRRVLAVV